LHREEPGTVSAGNNRIIVHAGRGDVEILELQPAGKRSMTAGEFLRGHALKSGDRFGRG
jgi:methionyl-tRNA formyltransferase